ncbi:MAG: hypothetical protein KDJ29_20200 [Hyphomicrobiales bacterium]|nr:hypothetical protein [Hyphomicrobiales bacterium]
MTANTPPVRAQTCLPMLNKLTRPLVKQVLMLGRKKACAKVPQFTRTKSIDLQRLRVCLEAGGISMEGVVVVACSTPPEAAISGSLEETVDFAGVFDIRRCRLRDVEVVPRSAMGKIVAGSLELEARLRAKVNRRLVMFCR